MQTLSFSALSAANDKQTSAPWAEGALHDVSYDTTFVIGLTQIGKTYETAVNIRSSMDKGSSKHVRWLTRGGGTAGLRAPLPTEIKKTQIV